MDVACPKHIIMKLPQNSRRTSGMDHPDFQVVCVMPHSPLHIWAHPHDRSLQPLYLSTLFHNLSVHNFTNLQTQDTGTISMAITPRDLRGPPPLTPMHAPLLPPPLVTLAHVGSDISGSGHQLWCQNLTSGHRRRVTPPPALQSGPPLGRYAAHSSPMPQQTSLPPKLGC